MHFATRIQRKPLSDVAAEVRASAKTVHRRLERMIENRLLEFPLEWYPDASNDIISIGHIKVACGAGRSDVLSTLRQTFSQNILVEMMFSNLPNELILFLWTNSMRQMDDLREGIVRAKGVGSATVNVLQIGYMFDTSVDRLGLDGVERAAVSSG